MPIKIHVIIIFRNLYLYKFLSFKKMFGALQLGFYLDINLVPLSRVLLERHPNSRFKGSLVEKP